MKTKILKGLMLIGTIFALTGCGKSLTYEDISLNADYSDIYTMSNTNQVNGSFDITFNDINGNSPFLTNMEVNYGIYKDIGFSGSVSITGTKYNNYDLVSYFATQNDTYLLDTNCKYLDEAFQETYGNGVNSQMYYDIPNKMLTVSMNGEVETGQMDIPASTYQMNAIDIYSYTDLLHDIVGDVNTKVSENGDTVNVNMFFFLNSELINNMSDENKRTLSKMGLDLNQMAQVLTILETNVGINIPINVDMTFYKVNDKYRISTLVVKIDGNLQNTISSDNMQQFNLSPEDNFSIDINASGSLVYTLNFGYEIKTNG